MQDQSPGSAWSTSQFFPCAHKADNRQMDGWRRLEPGWRPKDLTTAAVVVDQVQRGTEREAGPDHQPRWLLEWPGDREAGPDKAAATEAVDQAWR